MSTLEYLLNPRGIAVVGASEDSGRPGGQTISALVERGYVGGIYPVNPKYETLAGLRCYASIKDVPQPCDIAVIALPAAHVPEVVADCGSNGLRFAVVLGGGFREGGEAGQALERSLLENAKKYNVRLIGPNCLGMVNIHAAAFSAFGSLSRPPYLNKGHVSAVLQSGGFGNSLVFRCHDAGIGFRYVVTSGNEADISAPELINAFVDDPETKVILAYIEGVGDGRAFVAAAERARQAGKPVVVWKAGNTRQGLRAAASHTANMAGSYDIYRAAFKAAGIIEVTDMEEATDFVQALLGQPTASGRNVAVMGGSGGSAVVFSDAADAYGLTLAPLNAETMGVLRENLPSVASLDNPVDFAAGFLGDKNAGKLERAIDAILADPGIHQFGMLFATVSARSGVMMAQAMANAARRSSKPLLAFAAAPQEHAGEMFAILKKAGIPVTRSVKRLARSMQVLADFHDAKQHEHEPEPVTGPAIPANLLDGWSGTMNEHAAKLVLKACGIPVSDDILFPPAPISAHLAQACRFPAALKIVSADIAHKSDIGGVMLNLRTPAELAAASSAMLDDLSAAAPRAKLQGFLVSPMVSDGLETIVGIINDPVFGPVVAFGLGGVYAETLKDMTYRLAPFGEDTALQMIRELRAADLFKGQRGQRPRDVQALAQLLVTVSRLAWVQRERIAELDINPVLVRPEGQGVVAVDALIVLRPA
jgi:acetyltransferase